MNLFLVLLFKHTFAKSRIRSFTAFTVSGYQDRPADLAPLSPSDDPTPEFPGESRQPAGLTYDDLRRQNREQYEQRRYENMKRIQYGNSSAGAQQPRVSSEPDSFSGSLSDEKPKQGVKNPYGDVWDK
jgi:hypothetical protein